MAYRGNYGSTGYEVYLRGTNLLNRLAYNHASFISSVAPLLAAACCWACA